MSEDIICGINYVDRSFDLTLLTTLRLTLRFTRVYTTIRVGGGEFTLEDGGRMDCGGNSEGHVCRSILPPVGS